MHVIRPSNPFFEICIHPHFETHPPTLLADIKNVCPLNRFKLTI